MKIIKLTGSHTKENIYQVVDKIVNFGKNKVSGKTEVVTVEDVTAICVKETPEEIIELIKQAEEI